jgi:hypothetical protein
MAAASLALAALLLGIASLLLLGRQGGPLMPAMWLAGLVSLAAFWVFDSEQVTRWAERWSSRGSLPGVVLLTIGLSAALALSGWRLDTEWVLLICGVLVAGGLLCTVGYLVSKCRPRRSSPSPEPQGDLYAILGVAPEAEPDEIERAFRARAPMYLGGRAGRAALPEMIGLTLAYEMLSDPVRRAAYDRRRTGKCHPSLSVQKSAA